MLSSRSNIQGVVIRLVATTLVALAIFRTGATLHACDDSGCCCRTSDAFARTRTGAWFVVESPNFQVCSLTSSAVAEQVATQCECLRSRMEESWRGSNARWSPKCQIILHATVASYQRAVGRGGEATLGSSLVTPSRGAVGARRIDLRTDVDDVLKAALPHELCHVVLADHFRDGPPPLWFDEGVALQYDVRAKRELHERDFLRGSLRGSLIPLEDLFSQTSYPARGDEWGVFYGQSGSLVRWLLLQAPRERLLEFAKRSRTESVETALANTYKFSTVDELTRQWRRGSIALNAPLPPSLLLPAPELVELASR